MILELHRDGAVEASDELDLWLLLDLPVDVDDDVDDDDDASGLIRLFGIAPSDRFSGSGLSPGLGPERRLGGRLTSEAVLSELSRFRAGTELEALEDGRDLCEPGPGNCTEAFPESGISDGPADPFGFDFPELLLLKW